MAISADGKTLTLRRGDALAGVRRPATPTVFVPGPHGGLTVVHGGGNPAAELVRHDRARSRCGRPGRHHARVTRLDGLPWAVSDWFAGQRLLRPRPVRHGPQHVQVAGESRSRA